MTDLQSNKKTKKKDDFLMQGAILAVAMFLTKIIGVVYRIPLTNILGDEGNGFYGYAFEVYAMALMLSCCSFKVSFSKTCNASETKCVSSVSWSVGIFNCRRAGYLTFNLFWSRGNFYAYDGISAQCICTSSIGSRSFYCCCSWCSSRLFPGTWNYGPNCDLADH